MFLLDGKVLQLDAPFEHNGTQYPANWLRLASPEARAAIGITEVVEQQRPDDRFYWVSGPDNNGDYTAIPKDLAGLKTTWTAQFRQTAWTLLAPSDWMVIRKQEVDIAVPADWVTYREAVRTTCELAITDAELASDIDAFIAFVTSVQWPRDPNSVDVPVA